MLYRRLFLRLIDRTEFVDGALNEFEKVVDEVGLCQGKTVTIRVRRYRIKSRVEAVYEQLGSSIVKAKIIEAYPPFSFPFFPPFFSFLIDVDPAAMSSCYSSNVTSILDLSPCD